MSEIRIRPAAKTDAKMIAELSLVAGGGVVEYLLTGLMPGFSVQQMMQFRFGGDELPFSYLCCSVAEIDGEIAGISNAYSSDYNKIPSSSEKDFIPTDRINYLLKPLYKNIIPNSYYLNSIAIFEKFRGKKIGSALLNHVANEAKQKNFNSVILHAWTDNTKAIKLYEREGYKIIEHIDIQRQPLLPHDGGMELMQLFL